MTAPISEPPVEPSPVAPQGFAPEPRMAPPVAQPHPGLGAGHGPAGQFRNPVVVLLLSYVTFGIYAMYMQYTLNAEMKAFNPAVQVNPPVAVLALFVPIVSIISGIKTSERVRQVQSSVGLAPTCSGGLTFLCMLVGASFAYQQSQLNQVWSRTA